MDKIYENTVWKDGVDTADFSGMGFVIKKILVHQEWSPVGSNQVHYNMERSSWDVRNLLEVSVIIQESVSVAGGPYSKEYIERYRDRIFLIFFKEIRNFCSNSCRN